MDEEPRAAMTNAVQILISADGDGAGIFTAGYSDHQGRISSQRRLHLCSEGHFIRVA
jgi:hypothetical protein